MDGRPLGLFRKSMTRDVASLSVVPQLFPERRTPGCVNSRAFCQSRKPKRNRIMTRSTRRPWKPMQINGENTRAAGERKSALAGAVEKYDKYARLLTDHGGCPVDAACTLCAQQLHCSLIEAELCLAVCVPMLLEDARPVTATRPSLRWRERRSDPMSRRTISSVFGPGLHRIIDFRSTPTTGTGRSAFWRERWESRCTQRPDQAQQYA